MNKELSWMHNGGILKLFKITKTTIGKNNKQIDSIMKNNEVKVLGNDKQVHDVAAFVAAGKDHSDAIGIVFGSPIIGHRVLAFDAWLAEWGERKIHVEGRNESQAVQVLCGLDDTKRIVEAQSDNYNMTAAKRCWQYKRGDLQWYLPSLMELGALFLVRDEINDAMRQLGCDSDCLLPTEGSDERWLWSSSERSQGGCWGVSFCNGLFNNYGTCGSYVVRAVSTLYPLPSKNDNHSPRTEKSAIEYLRQLGYTGELTKKINV